MMKKFPIKKSMLLCCLSILLIGSVRGENEPEIQIKAVKTYSAITIDGLLNEPIWKTTDRYDPTLSTESIP